MSFDPLASAIVGHMVGDYLLQNDWMAANKKKRTLPCAVHCALWASAVVLFAGWGMIAWLALFLLHFAQDRTGVVAWWMDLIGQESFRTGPLAPWSSVVVDNAWHLVQIWAVGRFIA
jgi:hypothetical protein